MERLCRNIDVSGWDISAAEWPRIHTWGVALKIIGTVPKAWLFSKLIRGAFMYCHLIQWGTGDAEDIFELVSPIISTEDAYEA